MKRTSIFTLTFALMLIVVLLAGCVRTPVEQTQPPEQNVTPEKPATPETPAAPQEPIKISFMNTKGEIAEPLIEAAKVFSAENPGIELEIIPVAVGRSPFETISTMYNSGNAPTLAMLDAPDIPRFRENLMSLNDEKWISDLIDGTTAASTIDGITYGFPFTIEGFGLIYNRAVLDKAFGGNFDPSTITTRGALKDAFDKVEASGVDALVIAPMDWSLGAHMFSLFYLAEGKGVAQQYTRLFDDLKNGNLDLIVNQSFNNWLDTFDLLMEYNAEKDDPLSVTYEKGPELLGKSEIGFWFMGNWAWPLISQFDETNGQYGFLPLPLSDNASDFGNNSIVAFPAKFVAIDETQNSPEQQQAAKAFLNWLVYEESGQQALVTEMAAIPAFRNINIPIADPLGQSVLSYMSGGNIKSAIDAYTTMPPDHWAQVGAMLQKYLGNHSDRATLANEIVEYWKTKR